MGKHKTPTTQVQQAAPTARRLTNEDKSKVLRTRMQLARLLLSKDVPDILLPDLEKLMLAGNSTLLRRAERAEDAHAEAVDILGIEDDEIEVVESETAPSGPRRGVRR